MLKSLKDPSLPAGAIIEEFDDGGALRNDGVRLKPANQNPWYVLATLYGYADTSNPAEDYKTLNREAWSRRIVRREGLRTSKGDFDRIHLDYSKIIQTRTHKHDQRLESHFTEIFGKGTEILNDYDSIDLSDTYFPHGLDLSRLLFPLPVNINRSTFNRHLIIRESVFKEPVSISDIFIKGSLDAYKTLSNSSFSIVNAFIESDLDLSGFSEFKDILDLTSIQAKSLALASSKITDQVNITQCTLERHVDLTDVSWASLHARNLASKNIWFTSSSFSTALLDQVSIEEIADFEDIRVSDDFYTMQCRFLGITNFNNATFNNGAYFGRLTQLSNVSFNGASFGNTTNFLEAIFTGTAPSFFGSDLHQDTIFSRCKESYPTAHEQNAPLSINAYGRLRLYAKQQERPDEEHFFMRLEMRCKEARASRFYRILYWLYRQLSDYGYSVGRPLAGLAITIVFGWAFLGSYAQLQSGLSGSAGVFRGFGVSFSSTFSFLGLGRRFHGDFFDSTSPWLDFLSGFQTVVGVILVFLLGLGLRNHFRLK